MFDLIKLCSDETKRTYPPGYGFALAYLTADPGPQHFKAMQAAAWGAVKRQAKLGNRDAARFVSAYVDAQDRIPFKGGWRWWLIEAAQLVHADALDRRSNISANVMRLWGHPGF